MLSQTVICIQLCTASRPGALRCEHVLENRNPVRISGTVFFMSTLLQMLCGNPEKKMTSTEF